MTNSNALDRVKDFIDSLNANLNPPAIKCTYLTIYQLEQLAKHLQSKGLDGAFFMVGQTVNPLTNLLDEIRTEIIPVKCNLDCNSHEITYAINEGTLGGLNVNLPKVPGGCDYIFSNSDGGGGNPTNQQTPPPTPIGG